MKRPVRYYSTHINARTRAAQARITPEQIAAANEHAAKLRAQDAILLAGPVEAGPIISIPSWRWNPELVAAIKAIHGYHFDKELTYTMKITLHARDYTPTVTMSTWTIPAAPGRLEAIRAIYEKVFAREIAQARMTEMLAPLGRL
jgi:hypothetical protein